MASIYHIVAEADWRSACLDGSYRPPSLAEQGFVHFSHEHQVSRTANLLYHGQDGLIVVEIDPARLPAPVVEEDLYDAGERFPHVYAAIPTQAALAVHPLSRDDSGDYRFP
jgi:uncharacterized protein (DUF952 family)